MLKGLKKRIREDEGFTLIELMVVVLIIGILVAIALPTFLGARNRANDKAAQSGLRNALAAAKTCFTDNDAYNTDLNADADFADAGEECDEEASQLPSIETSLGFLAANVDSADPNDVSVEVAADIWYGASYSKSDSCFYIMDDPTAGTTYEALVGGAAATTCAGDDAEATAPAGSSW